MRKRLKLIHIAEVSHLCTISVNTSLLRFLWRHTRCADAVARADAARKKLTRRRPRPRRRPGPAGRARPSWPRRGARDRCRLRPDAIAPRPGRFRRLTRGPSSGPPDARPARQSDAAPQLRRAASRGTARRGRAAGALGRPSRGASRVFAALAALTGPKRWLCARAAPAKEASRRGSRSPTAASTRKLRP